jgi:hypothetical protein
MVESFTDVVTYAMYLVLLSRRDARKRDATGHKILVRRLDRVNIFFLDEVPFLPWERNKSMMRIA